MARGKQYTNLILIDETKIIDFIEQISSEMAQYINENNESKFTLFYKYLTHSDIATFGKATKLNSHDKNLLYYINTEEMLEIEEKTKKPFQTAHQSCIGLMKEWYTIVDLPQPRDGMYLLNDYCDVFLVNENLNYFKSRYTEKVFEILNKQISSRSKLNWNFADLDVELSGKKFTPIQLHCAVHGLGIEKDEQFHKLRHHLFKGDAFVILFEKTVDNKKRMFILLEKNPVFYTILGETNKSYEEYQKKSRERLIKKHSLDDIKVVEDDEVTRAQQSAWRKKLAEEIMCYSPEDNAVFCPLTYIQANFDEMGGFLLLRISKLLLIKIQKRMKYST